jgi:hypothetical protein
VAKGHKLYTEKVRGGVIADCLGESCTWSGKYKYRKVVDKNARPRVSVDAEDSVFPNRQLAVEAHRAFHAAKE